LYRFLQTDMGNTGASQLLGMAEAPNTFMEGINGVVAKVHTSLLIILRTSPLTVL